MDDKLYRFRNWDYCVPSFCSFEISYYGTQDQVMKVLKLQEVGLAEAANQFFSGTGDGAASICYGEPSPIVYEVTKIKEKKYTAKDIKTVVYNIWKCANSVTIDELEADIIYIKDTDEKYKRLIKPRVTNAIIENMKLTDGWFWGMPGFFTVEDDQHVSCGVYYCDMVFENYEEMMNDFENTKEPNLNRFILEMFGDG